MLLSLLISMLIKRLYLCFIMSSDSTQKTLNSENYPPIIIEEKKKMARMILETRIQGLEISVYIYYNLISEAICLLIAYLMINFTHGIKPTISFNEKQIQSSKKIGQICSIYLLVRSLYVFYKYYVYYNRDPINYFFYENFVNPLDKKMLKDNDFASIIFSLIENIVLTCVVLFVFMRLFYPTESISDILKKKDIFDFKQLKEKYQKREKGKDFMVISTYENIFIRNIILIIFAMFVTRLIGLSIAFNMRYTIIMNMKKMAEEDIQYFVTDQSAKDIITSLYS